MIKVEFGMIKLYGNKPIIRSELATLINSLYKNNILTKEELEADFNFGLMNDEELTEMQEKMMEKIFGKIKKELDKME